VVKEDSVEVEKGCSCLATIVTVPSACDPLAGGIFQVESCFSRHQQCLLWDEIVAGFNAVGLLR